MEMPVAKENNFDDMPTPKKGQLKRQLRLSSVPAGRKTCARLIRLYDAGELSEGKFRTLLYGMKSLLFYFEVEKNLSFEEDIVYIKETLEMRK